MGSVCQVLDSDEESECAGVGCEPCDGVKGGASDDVSVCVCELHVSALCL